MDSDASPPWHPTRTARTKTETAPAFRWFMGLQEYTSAETARFNYLEARTTSPASYGCPGSRVKARGAGVRRGFAATVARTHSERPGGSAVTAQAPRAAAAQPR